MEYKPLYITERTNTHCANCDSRMKKIKTEYVCLHCLERIKQVHYSVGIIYVIGETGTNFYKIGRTNNINLRLMELQVGNPRELFIDRYFNTDVALLMEAIVHAHLSMYRIRGEWFNMSKTKLPADIDKLLYAGIRKAFIEQQDINSLVEILYGYS